jgi:hypothetical protein
MAAAGNRCFILIRGAVFVLPSGAASRSPLGRSGKPNHQGFGRTPISDLDIKTSTYIGLDDDQDHLNA